MPKLSVFLNLYTKRNNKITTIFCPDCPMVNPALSVTSGLLRPSPLTCAVGHAGTFTVKPALVASQW